MASHYDLYEQKKVSPEEVVRKVKPGQTIYTGLLYAHASAFMNALGEHGDHLHHLTIWSVMGFVPHPVLLNPEHSIITGFLGPVERMVRKQSGIIDFYPVQYCDIVRVRDEIARPDWSALTLTSMDEEGYFNFHMMAATEVPLFRADCARPETTTVVEVNKHLPRLYGLPEFGSHRVHVSEVDYIIENHQRPIQLPSEVPTPEDYAIAGHVAELINNGDTIQVGIGTVTDAVASFLTDKIDLGVHTEMIGDGLMRLIRSGAVSNRLKTLYPEKTVASFALGSPDLMNWLDGNPGILMLPINEVNSPWVVSRNRNMVSINNILAIDFRGQATAHTIGGRTYSGIGGSLEFSYGAQMASGGRSILCLHSTRELASGRVSNIVPSFPPGAAVTIPEFMADWVVTEHGAVRLKTTSMRKRAEALISISHPDFRDELTESARELGIQ
jgi:acyl-CoA hydrolase